MTFSKSLIYWYLQNKRDLPWRKTTNPYPIWLSEIILQQTKVAQGMPYFLSFIDAFPTVFDLANASEEEVLKLWQGLGYYSRARNLHATAKYIAFDLNGIFPDSYQNLLLLKGVGSYTAAAIASFAYNEPVAVVDGNVYRVLARFFDVDTDISSSKAPKEFAALAQSLLPKDTPAIFNQAIMEFGALQCVPQKPNCQNCIFTSNCAALQKNKVAILPVKLKKTKISKRYFNYLIYTDTNKATLLQKRTEKGIWQNLYEFPLIETSTEVFFDAILMELSQTLPQNYHFTGLEEEQQPQIIHKLSHQHLHIKFWKVHLNCVLENGVTLADLHKYPVPIVLHHFIKNL